MKKKVIRKGQIESPNYNDKYKYIGNCIKYKWKNVPK